MKSINQGVALIFLIITLIFLTFSKNYFVFYFALISCGLVAIVSKDLKFTSFIKGVLPFFIFGVLSSWFQLFFGKGTFVEGLAVAHLIVIRSVAMGSLASIFIQILDPQKLLSSLVQQFKFPSALSFSVVGALNFIPALKSELKNFMDSRMIRGKSPHSFINASVFLLSVGIRRAIRMSLAMEMRGFKIQGDRTYYHEVSFQIIDLFIVFYSALLIVLSFLKI